MANIQYILGPWHRPFLKRFVQDWATQALAMQLLKNRQCHSYCCGYLEVPNKYAYLKDTATKRKSQGSQSTKATPQLDGEERVDGNSTDGSIVASGKAFDSTGSRLKHVAPVPVAAQQPRKKQKTTRSTAKGKAKKRGPIGTKNEEEIQISNEVDLKEEEAWGEEVCECALRLRWGTIFPPSCHPWLLDLMMTVMHAWFWILKNTLFGSGSGAIESWSP